MTNPSVHIIRCVGCGQENLKTSSLCTQCGTTLDLPDTTRGFPGVGVALENQTTRQVQVGFLEEEILKDTLSSNASDTLQNSSESIRTEPGIVLDQTDKNPLPPLRSKDVLLIEKEEIERPTSKSHREFLAEEIERSTIRSEKKIVELLEEIEQPRIKKTTQDLLNTREAATIKNEKKVFSPHTPNTKPITSLTPAVGQVKSFRTQPQLESPKKSQKNPLVPLKKIKEKSHFPKYRLSRASSSEKNKALLRHDSFFLPLPSPTKSRKSPPKPLWKSARDQEKQLSSLTPIGTTSTFAALSKKENPLSSTIAKTSRDASISKEIKSAAPKAALKVTPKAAPLVKTSVEIPTSLSTPDAEKQKPIPQPMAQTSSRPLSTLPLTPENQGSLSGKNVSVSQNTSASFSGVGVENLQSTAKEETNYSIHDGVPVPNYDSNRPPSWLPALPLPPLSKELKRDEVLPSQKGGIPKEDKAEVALSSSRAEVRKKDLFWQKLQQKFFESFSWFARVKFLYLGVTILLICFLSFAFWLWAKPSLDSNDSSLYNAPVNLSRFPQSLPASEKSILLPEENEKTTLLEFSITPKNADILLWVEGKKHNSPLANDSVLLPIGSNVEILVATPGYKPQQISFVLTKTRRVEISLELVNL